MTEIRNTSKNKRDVMLLVILFLLVGGVYLAFQLFAFRGDQQVANIYYGSGSNPIVTIDFVNFEVTKRYNQPVPEGYGSFPIIDEEQQTITLLGDYTIGGVRQIVVIKYTFATGEHRGSVEIIEEQSPNHICSREGVSTGKPLICLPNRIRVEFGTNDSEDFVV